MPDAAVDPVSGLSIPEAWLKLSRDPEVLEKIRTGRWVILSDGRLLRRGYTTGTTAAAACKGAVISLMKPLKEVDVMTPVGIRVDVAVSVSQGFCRAVKDGGDHQFDTTD